MSLTKSQFDLLRPLAEGETDSAPATAEAAELTARGLLCAGRLTDAGLAALEPYRVRRMVVLAAGFGSRLRPVTLRTPKPLVRVNGRRIIDSLLDAACAAGIEDIVLVRGYLGGQFDGPPPALCREPALPGDEQHLLRGRRARPACRRLCGGG